MKRQLLLSCIILVFCNLSFTQVNEIELNPDGVIVPRLDRTTIVSPVAGQLVYDINSTSFWFHNGVDWTELAGIFERSGNTVRQSSGYDTDSFLFGSPQMDDDGNIDHNSRMFFNKQKRAFRVGSTRDTSFFTNQISGSATVWNQAQLGYYSFAGGLSNEASGASSFSMGEVSTASGRYAMAMGWGANATGRASVSFGFQSAANGFASTAFGRGTIANGETSTVIGRWSEDIDHVQTGVDDTTRLFIIGNGNDAVSRSNALVVQNSGRVGIGTNSPDAALHISGNSGEAALHVDEGKTVLLGADTVGAGIKAFWLPAKAAFRAGAVGDGDLQGQQYFSESENWDSDSIGLFSFASGLAAKAIAKYSVALGETSISSGIAALSTGSETIAKGDFSAAFGNNTAANGERSLAIGSGSIANGFAATVIGSFNESLDQAGQIFNDTTRLFIIGNGNKSDDRSNAMVVQKNGRVGIGTNSPDAYLHVSGGDAILDRSTSTQGLTRTLIIGGAKATNDTAYAELIFKNYDHDNVIEYTGAKIISYNPTNGSNRGDLRFLTAPDGTQQRERMRIEGQGNVGIDCDPAVKFQVGDSGDGSTAEANAWNTFSDRRYKNDIRSIENANQLISQLNGRRFSWKKSGQNDLGFIAQEVEQVLPEIVHTNENGLKSLDYAKITPVLVEAIKEQWETIDEQQQMINKQSKDIAELKRMIHGLMAERTGDR